MPKVSIYRSRNVFDGKKSFVELKPEEVLEISEYTNLEVVNSHCFCLTLNDQKVSFCYGKTRNRDEYLTRLLLGIKLAQDHGNDVNVLLY